MPPPAPSPFHFPASPPHTHAAANSHTALVQPPAGGYTAACTNLPQRKSAAHSPAIAARCSNRYPFDSPRSPTPANSHPPASVAWHRAFVLNPTTTTDSCSSRSAFPPHTRSESADLPAP